MSSRPAYVPLMLREGWVLERYFGWSVLGDGEGLKLLVQKRGPIRRHILLLRGARDSAIVAVAREHRLFGRTAATRIVDLDARDAAFWLELSGTGLKELLEDRWFGVGTFAVDLAREEVALWGAMSQRSRRMCRKAERAGLNVELRERPGREELRGFFELFEPMARERKLHAPPRRALEQMCSRGEALLASCLDSQGRPVAINLVFIREDSGFYLYGARRDRASDGAAHFAHWRTIVGLKANGLAWYDLGQVPDRGPGDGLYAFKKEFGGEFLDYGREYDWSPSIVNLAARAARLGRRGWAALAEARLQSPAEARVKRKADGGL